MNTFELPYPERHSGFIKDYNEIVAKWRLTITYEPRVVEYVLPITSPIGNNIPPEETHDDSA